MIHPGNMYWGGSLRTLRPSRHQIKNIRGPASNRNRETYSRTKARLVSLNTERFRVEHMRWDGGSRRPDLVRVLISTFERLDRVPARLVPVRQVEALTWEVNRRVQLEPRNGRRSAHLCLGEQSCCHRYRTIPARVCRGRTGSSRGSGRRLCNGYLSANVLFEDVKN